MVNSVAAITINKKGGNANRPFLIPSNMNAGSVMGTTSLEIWIKICRSLATTNVLSVTGLGSIIILSLISINTEVKSAIRVDDKTKIKNEK